MSDKGKQPKKLIGELLVTAGLVTDKQLAEALEFQRQDGGKIVDALITLGHIDAKQFVKFLARQPGVASIDLSNYEIPRKLIELVPREDAIKHEVFPIDRMGNLLTLGMVCPLDAKSITELEEKTGLRIKPLLCSPEDIRGAIRRYYPQRADEKTPAYPNGDPAQIGNLASSLRLNSLVQMIRRIKSLPALPETVDRVLAATKDPNVSVKDVVGIINRDPPIAAKVLSVANSAAYGFPHRVDRVELAVSLLGLRETYAIVLSAAVINLFDRSKVFDYQGFWRESLQCAGAMRLVGRGWHKGHAGSLVPIGLLLNIGRIALSEVIPDRYAKVPQHLRGAALVRAEEDVCAIGHPEAGYELASKWGLPEEIPQAIRFQYQPEMAQAHQPLAAMANLAHTLVTAEEGEDTDALESASNALNILKLDHDTALGLLREFRARSDEYEEIE